MCLAEPRLPTTNHKAARLFREQNVEGDGDQRKQRLLRVAVSAETVAA
jgi:hypothetical protein